MRKTLVKQTLQKITPSTYCTPIEGITHFSYKNPIDRVIASPNFLAEDMCREYMVGMGSKNSTEIKTTTIAEVVL